MKVNNKGVIRRLTWRSLQSGRFRNLMAIFAIALTSILFTSVTTLGGGMLQSVTDNTFRQVGSSSHGGYKYLTEEEYAKIVAAGEYEDISYNIVMGFATNPELNKKQHELRYTEAKQAEWGFSYPTVGTLPKEYKDIAVSTTTLDMLGLPHELGQTIPLDFRVGEEEYSDDFTLVGFWPGDEVMMATQCFFSRDYVRAYAPNPTGDWDNMDATGRIDASVWFKNSVDVEAKLNALTTAAGLDPEKVYIGVNWAYAASGDLDFITIFLIAGVVLLIMLSGYLIIYSIFAISVSGDIQFYGLLKTIGTTGRQIKRIVRGQALVLAAVGIPIGLASGFLLGSKLAPVMISITIFDAPSSIEANPWIFLLSALFSLITVFISCRKPGNMAAKVSPVEALRYTEQTNAPKQKGKKSRKVTPFTMAWANVNRSRKRLVVVLMSLSLSLVLLNSVVSIANGFDMDIYLEKSIVSDFYFTNVGVLNNAIPLENRNYQAIPNALVEETAQLPGLERYGRIFYNASIHSFQSEAMVERFEQIVRPHVTEQWGGSTLDQAVAEGYTFLQIYGLDPFPFEHIRDNYQEIDWEKFSSGNYALISPYDGDEEYNGGNAFYKVGEKIPLEGADGQIVEYEVLGYINYPFSMGSQVGLAIDSTVVLSADHFKALYGEQQPFSLMADVADDSIESAEVWAENWVDGPTSELTYRSRAYYVNEFIGMQNSYLMLGGILAFILALIGIMNFINTMATSIMTRRREFAMLQSVGMTGKQLKQMLFYEGAWYGLLTLALTLTVGSGISALLIQEIAEGIWYFRFHFSLTPILLCAPVLMVLCVAVPLLCSRILQRDSVIDRLREN